MNRKILFISKYPKIIQEFLEAMSSKDVEIDTASNGVEAAAKLKKNVYQVVVTGLSLDGYNGEQLITYLNKACPNTVCIIYTTTISPAQLHFFINEREVFRVFLRPVDFHGEFFLALEEAFEYYDVRVKNSEEAVEESAREELRKQEVKKIVKKLHRQNQTLEAMKRYVKRQLDFTLCEYADHVDAELVQQMRELEYQTVDVCLAKEGDVNENFIRAMEDIGKIKALCK